MRNSFGHNVHSAPKVGRAQEAMFGHIPVIAQHGFHLGRPGLETCDVDRSFDPVDDIEMTGQGGI